MEDIVSEPDTQDADDDPDVADTEPTDIVDSVGEPEAVTLTSVEISPAGSVDLEPGESQPFTATAWYSDMSSLVVTADAEWIASDTSIASFDGTTGSEGLLWANVPGITDVYAVYGGMSSATVTVTVANVATCVSVTLDPTGPLSIPLGRTQSFTATCTMSDSSTTNVTATATWSSTVPAVADFASLEFRHFSSTAYQLHEGLVDFLGPRMNSGVA